MLVIALASLSLAGPPDVPDRPLNLEPEEESDGLLADTTAPAGVMVVLRGVGEFWHDTAIASNYRNGGLVPAVGAVVPISDRFALDAGIGYHRASSTEGSGVLQLVPMSLLFEVRLLPGDDRALELFAGAGPAMVVWTESGQDPTFTAEEGSEVGPAVLRGARPGAEIRLGGRIDLGLVDETMMPGQQDALRGVALELLGSRRFAPKSSGFNLNTWRLGAGLALSF